MSNFIGKILIACEFSGIVRNEFAKLGWDAWSCDLLHSELPGNHIMCDVRVVLNDNWDMIIAFPPCTYLTYAGMSSWYDDGRAMKRIKAAELFIEIYQSHCKFVCVENPRGIMTKIFRKADQEIHPYFFGDPFMKRTQLWLKNLPPLIYSLDDNLFFKKTAIQKPIPKKYYFSTKKNRQQPAHFCMLNSNSHIRSKTFKGIAVAMATQWTNYYLNY